uniref:Si:dkey-17e16.17 n=1 Tax=Nothobranchius kuhntae TaxID=321403 RepID=A0A1A8IKQ7_NOTKU
MDYSQPFSVLNERLRPRSSTKEQLISSLGRLENRKLDSFRSKSTSYTQTVLQTEPEPKVSITDPEDLEETKSYEEEEELVCGCNGEGKSEDLMLFDDLIGDLCLKEVDDEEMSTDDSSVTHSEETDSAGELVSVGTRDPSKSGASSEAEGSFQRSCMDRSLPDLIKSGRPLCRRRTVAHVSETLKEVRREVELSRRRSIKLKAQVDKLQENRDGPGWSKHKESVTEEVLSVLGLLHPLVEPEFSQPKLGGGGESRLETAVAQLQIVARKLVISHSKQESKSGTEDSGVLQQALRDRDDAIEKKKAMEAEVLRSKTEMMVLNNHLLEAAQKRLELSLELEAWKEDFQRLLQQLVQMQQQADQAQKKSSRMGILRRINKTPVQRPANCPLPGTSTPPTTNSNQIYKIESAGSASPTPSSSSGGSGSSKGTWKLKSKKSRNSRLWYQEQDSDHCKYDDGFQVVSLD